MKTTHRSRLLTLACSALGCFASIPAIPAIPAIRAEAEPQHPAKPLLWKIEGKELAQPSYLFGTIHISKGPAVTLHPSAPTPFSPPSGQATGSFNGLHTESKFLAATPMSLVATYLFSCEAHPAWWRSPQSHSLRSSSLLHLFSPHSSRS